MSGPDQRRGLLLFAHGARDPNWALPFQAVAEQVRAGAATRGLRLEVRLAFLEFMQPDLPSAGDELARAGCSEVDVVPLFLGAGGHVRKDLPVLMETLVERYPAVEWTLRPAIGEMPSIVAAMADASLAWITSPTSGNDEPT
jgi:sirohydrochlorin cobaltochelatase